MKKRTFIAAALAMAALVGCQKELAPVVGLEQTGNAGFDQRPVVGNVALTIGGAETRATVGSNGYNWTPEVGDAVGAMLVDEVVASEGIDGYYVQGKTDKGQWTYAQYATATPKTFNKVDYLFTDTYVSDEEDAAQHTGQAFYKITNDVVYSNYPYTSEDGKSYTTPASLVEGHYVFYAPYSERTGARGPVVVTLPVNQDVSETSKAVKDFYNGENPAMLAAAYVSAKDTKSIKATMSSIFAYPQFTIVNKFDGYLFDGDLYTDKVTYVSTEAESKKYDMKLIQMEIFLAQNSNNLLAYKRALKAQALYDAMEATEAGEMWNNHKTVYKTLPTSSVVSSESAYTVINGFSADESPNAVFENEMGTANTPQQRIVLDFGGKELKYGDPYTFFAIMPAEDYTEAELTARILVEIGGKEYYIWTSGNGKPALAEEAVTNALKGHAKTTAKKLKDNGADYKFYDRHNRGSNTLVLVRGQRYPDAEVYSDKTYEGGLKSFAGEMLTVELTGGFKQLALAKAVEPEEEVPVEKGIRNNTDFIDYINSVRTDANLEQKEDELADDAPANEFHLTSDNTVTLDGEIVTALAKMQQGKTITFYENIPIGDGVTVTVDDEYDGDGTAYVFSTAGGDSYTIIYTEDADFNSDGTKLVSGINVITNNNTTLKAGAGENAVVFVKIDAEKDKVVAISDPAGINQIFVEGDVTVQVNATADVTAIIDAPEATVVINKASKGGLTNPNNVFKIVENNALAPLAFVEDDDHEVTVKFLCYGWNVASPIPASSKVNDLTVDQLNKGELEIGADMLTYVGALKGVNIYFTEFVTGLFSKNDVEIDVKNINSLNATKIEDTDIVWRVEGLRPIEINAKDVTFVNIKKAEKGVTFVGNK